MTYSERPLVPLIGKTTANTNWWTAFVHLLVLLLANGTLIFVLAALGSKWRNPVPALAWGLVPALAMGIAFGELSSCIVNVVWGFGSFAARLLLLSAAILFAAPVGAFAVKLQPKLNDIRDWIDVLFVYCSLLALFFLVTKQIGLRAVIIGDEKNVTRRQWQWSLGQLFSVLTAIAAWLGTVVTLNPSTDDFRFGTVRWGAMLSLNLSWIPFACAACWLPTLPRPILLWLPFALCPIAEFAFEFFKLGQGDIFLHAWLAPIYKDDDYWPRSGIISRILLLEVVTALLSAFFAWWRVAGIRFKFQPAWRR